MQGDGGREQVVEDPIGRIIDGFDIGHTAVAIDRQIADVARRAAQLPEDFVTLLAGLGFEVIGRLEIVRR